MYITVNKEQIDIRLNPYIYVNVLGPDPLYYVELREYVNNDNESKFVEGYEAYINELDIAEALKKLNQLRVLVAVRESNRGMKAINKFIELHLCKCTVNYSTY